MTGQLVVIPASATDSTMADSGNTVRKPLDKTLTREIKLSRLLIGSAREWKVVQVTGAFVSTIAPTTSILSLNIHSSSGVDTTIYNPLQWFSLRHVLKFGLASSTQLLREAIRWHDEQGSR